MRLSRSVHEELLMKVLSASAALLLALCSCSSSDSADPAATPTSDAGPVGPADSAPPEAKDAAASDGNDAGAPLDPRDGPGTFAGVGNHVRHIRSLDDGLTWIDDATDIAQTETGDAVGIRNVVWGNGLFVAFAAKVLTSTDGKSWKAVPKPDGQWLASMLYAEGQWVSSGGYGWLATTTTDLGNWTQHPPQKDYTAAHHSRLALAHGKVNGAESYVAINDAGVIWRATDGKTWLPTTGAPVVPAGNTWGTAFAYGGGVFIGLPPSGMATIRSTDGGATWTSLPALATEATAIIYAQGHFTRVGSGRVYTSPDGLTWTDHVAASAVSGDLTYGHGVYLMVTNGAIRRSTDESTWKQVFDTGANPDSIAALAFGPK